MFLAVWRRSDSILVSLALSVLRKAAYHSSNEAVGTIEVRLCLRVVGLFLPRRDLLEAYWIAATEMPRRPWAGCHDALRAIEVAFADAGWMSPEAQPDEGWNMCNRFRMSARQAELAAHYAITVPYLPDEVYPSRMSLRCLFGVHRPLLASIIGRPYGNVALCDGCSVPLKRSEDGHWKPAEPLVTSHRL